MHARLHLPNLPIRRSLLALAAMVTILAIASSASAQSYQVVKLADGVYAAMASPEVRTNSGIIVGADSVIVVDSPLRPLWGRDLVAEIKKITDKPVRFVINTHMHGDHVYGNQAFTEAYGPGVQFIAQELTREDVMKGLPNLARTGQTAPPNIARLEKELADGKDPMGNVLDAGMRSAVDQQLSVQKGMLAEYASIKPVVGSITYEDKLILHTPERDIELLHLGKGHTRGDTVVYLPKEKIVFTGDDLAMAIPNMGSGYPIEWIATAQAIRDLDWTVAVTGHEGLQRDKQHIDRWIAYLTALVAAVKEANAKGETLEQAQKSIDLSSFAGDFSNFKIFEPLAINRTWAEVTGQIKD